MTSDGITAELTCHFFWVTTQNHSGELLCVESAARIRPTCLRRKRVHQAYEDASLPNSQEGPAARRARFDEPTYKNSGRLARKTDDEPKKYNDGTKKSGWKWRLEENHVYPQQDDLEWPYKRPGMGDAVTERMKQNSADQGLYGRIMQVDGALEKGNRRGLKELGIQRNHTIATAQCTASYGCVQQQYAAGRRCTSSR